MVGVTRWATFYFVLRRLGLFTVTIKTVYYNHALT
jgi:hypothetical protein